MKIHSRQESRTPEFIDFFQPQPLNLERQTRKGMFQGWRVGVVATAVAIGGLFLVGQSNNPESISTECEKVTTEDLGFEDLATSDDVAKVIGVASVEYEKRLPQELKESAYDFAKDNFLEHGVIPICPGTAEYPFVDQLKAD